ncbi:unnamed protein product [Vitrella brassicaformis CCMP3155]|uniref:Uncharacterized protein n=1 Tax=Vitrella brassicaformis (strain CCMP3155) TaxID=1169540 RepID=A0A0G4FBH9_VITBC|nr:unnamed protein product [Vitrella brassicaformis CCMP3155]|eukprot:CEM10281.1 unnamed protein product [Vitrella brassicaformis CCMP3155]
MGKKGTRASNKAADEPQRRHTMTLRASTVAKTEAQGATAKDKKNHKGRTGAKGLGEGADVGMKGMAKDNESVSGKEVGGPRVTMLVPPFELEKGMPLVDEQTIQRTRPGRTMAKRPIGGTAESNIAEPVVPKKTNNGRAAGLSETIMALEASFAGEGESLRGVVGLKDMAVSGDAGYGQPNLNKCASLGVNEAPQPVTPPPASPRKQPRSPDSKSPAHKCDNDDTEKWSRLAAPDGIPLPPVGHGSEKRPGDYVVKELACREQPPFPVAEEANGGMKFDQGYKRGHPHRSISTEYMVSFFSRRKRKASLARALKDGTVRAINMTLPKTEAPHKTTISDEQPGVSSSAIGAPVGCRHLLSSPPPPPPEAIEKGDEQPRLSAPTGFRNRSNRKQLGLSSPPPPIPEPHPKKQPQQQQQQQPVEATTTHAMATRSGKRGRSTSGRSPTPNPAPHKSTNFATNEATQAATRSEASKGSSKDKMPAFPRLPEEVLWWPSMTQEGGVRVQINERAAKAAKTVKKRHGQNNKNKKETITWATPGLHAMREERIETAMARLSDTEISRDLCLLRGLAGETRAESVAHRETLAMMDIEGGGGAMPMEVEEVAEWMNGVGKWGRLAIVMS